MTVYAKNLIASRIHWETPISALSFDDVPLKGRGLAPSFGVAGIFPDSRMTSPSDHLFMGRGLASTKPFLPLVQYGKITAFPHIYDAGYDEGVDNLRSFLFQFYKPYIVEQGQVF